MIRKPENIVRVLGWSCRDSRFKGRLAVYAPYFLANVPQELRAYVGWDNDGDLAKTFTALLARQAYVACAWLGGRALALAWLREISPLAAEAHFLICQRKPKAVLEAGREFIRQAERRYPSLTALVPRPFIGAKRLAEALGFQFLAKVPKVCALKSMGKIADGLLYSYQAKKGFII